LKRSLGVTHALVLFRGGVEDAFRQKRKGALCFLLVAFSAAALAGDDLIIDGENHRFEGADAFEPNQECKDAEGNV
jgi:hypothetical protein